MRKILIVTERRADYSRFKPIIDEIKKDSELDYYLVATGLHLLKEYGRSLDLIKKDDIKVSKIIPMFREGVRDTGAEMVKATGRFMVEIAGVLEKVKPDIVLSGFDIGANFATAVVAAHMNIPVGHVQGGEISGSIDESLRHATTKFAHFHFPATKEAARRIVRMGENPKCVFPVGCPSIDTLLSARDIPPEFLNKTCGIDVSKKFILIIQHTVTTEIDAVPVHIKATLDAVRDAGIPALLLYPNNDAGARAILKAIRGTNIHQVRTLSYEVFANVLKRTAALVGNSSTGIHETATFKIPTVNIGDRQKGRMRPQNVIDVPNDMRAIRKAIDAALRDKVFLKKVRRCKNPYGDGKSATRIAKVLKTIPLTKELVKKSFVE